MPRKVSLPPAILKVESLSDGREIRPETFTSDIGEHETLPIEPDPTLPRVMRSGNEILSEIKQQKIAKQLDMLKALGIVQDDRPKPEPKPVAPHKPGMRQVGMLGPDRALYIPLPPYRRF